MVALPDYAMRAGLRSALARPENLAAYGEPDLHELAAAYASGISQNHPFVDGNKRTAFLVAATFLDLNGQELKAPEAEAAVVFLRLAAGEFSEAELAEWFRGNCEPPASEFLVAEQDRVAMVNAPATEDGRHQGIGIDRLPSGHASVAAGRIGVLLVNLGTPEGTSYWPMRRYLSEFLSDRRVIEKPPLFWQPICRGSSWARVRRRAARSMRRSGTRERN